jgi:DNA-binding phage protein
MLRVTKPQTSRGKSRVKYPGITRVARENGVTRTHLYLVLEGDRISPRLKRAYAQARKLQEAA